MNIPDIWSIVTGTASLISLFFSLGDKFADWRKYTIPAAAGLGGFAAGRMSPALLTGINQLFTDPRTIGFILIFFLILSALILIAYALMKRGETSLAYIVFMMGMLSLPTSIIPMYTKTFETIPTGDYVKLAQIKIESEEYAAAVHYLEIAKENTKNKEFQKQLEKKIEDLLAEEAGSLSNNSNE
jgi:hypothetical protein